MKLSICSDIHLNFLSEDHVLRFADQFINSDALLIVGDISEADTLEYHMSLLRKKFSNPVYFVLGNHDYWNGGFDKVENNIRSFCAENQNFYWLTDNKVINLNDDTCLIGVDGWYDALYGEWKNSPFLMNDWGKIEEFYMSNNISINEFVDISRKRSLVQTKKASHIIEEASKKYKNIIFATHVPPWPEVSKKRGDDVDYLSIPFYTSKIMGDMLIDKADANPSNNFFIYCGHCHHSSVYQPRSNLIARSIQSRYGSPQIFITINL